MTKMPEMDWWRKRWPGPGYVFVLTNVYGWCVVCGSLMWMRTNELKAQMTVVQQQE